MRSTRMTIASATREELKPSCLTASAASRATEVFARPLHEMVTTKIKEEGQTRKVGNGTKRL